MLYIDLANRGQLVVQAVEARPELENVRLQLKQTEVDLEVARNQLLPALGVNLEGSRDIGNGARKQLNDSELLVRVKLEVPLQMRKQKGKRDSLKAQKGELERYLAFLRDKVTTEVNKAITKMEISIRSIDLAEREFRAASELEEGERTKFSVGDSNLVFVNIREQTAAEAAITKINSLAEYQIAYSVFQASMGREQN